MERPRLTLIMLMYGLLCSQRRISGEEVEMKVRPGENVTLYCDLYLTLGFSIVWIRNCTHEDQPSLVIEVKNWQLDYITQHFSFINHRVNNSYDLHITNISVSHLGLYYCAKREHKINDDEKGISGTTEYYYGNRTTRLSFAEPTLLLDRPKNVSEHVFCWTLLFSLCPVCVLLSSLLSSICVYYICRPQTKGSDMSAEMRKANIFMADCLEKHQCAATGKICIHSEVSYRLLTDN